MHNSTAADSAIVQPFALANVFIWEVTSNQFRISPLTLLDEVGNALSCTHALSDYGANYDASEAQRALHEKPYAPVVR